MSKTLVQLSDLHIGPQVEDDYLCETFRRVTALHPDIVVYWNGRKVAEGLDSVRRFHIDELGFGSTPRQDYQPDTPKPIISP